MTRFVLLLCYATACSSTNAGRAADFSAHGPGESSWWRTQIDYLKPPASNNSHEKNAFIGSPSIVATSSSNSSGSSAGAQWLASHDRFFDEAVGTTYIFASNDLIEWRPTASVSPMYATSPLMHPPQRILLSAQCTRPPHLPAPAAKCNASSSLFSSISFNHPRFRLSKTSYITLSHHTVCCPVHYSVCWSVSYKGAPEPALLLTCVFVC